MTAPAIPTSAGTGSSVAGSSTDYSAAAQTEQRYISVMQQYGVALTPNELTMIGPKICDVFDQGLSFGGVTRGVQNGEPQLDNAHAQYLVAGAVAAYCSEYTSKITG